MTFRSLSKEDFKGIAKIMAGDLVKVMAEKEIGLSFTPEALALIADKSYSAKFGARNMRRFIETEVEDRIASEIIRSKGTLKKITVDSDGDRITTVSSDV